MDSITLWTAPPPGQHHLPGQHPSDSTPLPGQQVGGTNFTGMLSCFFPNFELVRLIR